MFRLTLTISLLSFIIEVYAQSALSSYYFNYHLIDRSEILSSEINPLIHTSVKPYRRDALASYIKNNYYALSDKDSFNRSYLMMEHPDFITELPKKKGFLDVFYQFPSALYYTDYQGEDGQFKVLVNPILNLQAVPDLIAKENLFQNTRGVEVRGIVGNKVGFYTRATENQLRFPDFMREEFNETRVISGVGLAKYNSENSVHDFFNVSGYFTYSPMKEIMLQFGHDRNFIGNGYRSLILSDHALEYPFFKINTQVWKLNYQNLLMQHMDRQGTLSSRQGTPRKFSAFHHLSVNIGKNLNIGLFENVIFDRQQDDENNRYDFQYLNPIIFYRAVEHGLNSTDNALLGMDWKWNFGGRFSFYGQIILDEFVKDALVSRPPSWVNKWAWQSGLKYINVLGLKNLDMQLEFNQVRPYVYSHFSRSQNWAHHNQALAHPLGANFREYIGILRWQATNRLNFEVFLSYSQKGLNDSTLNYGGDFRRTYDDIPDKNNTPILQGKRQNISTSVFSVNYMVFQNFFIDARIYHRRADSELSGINENLIFNLGLRLNAPLRKYE